MALKHSTMTLYSSPLGIASHRTRIALAEKSIAANIVYVDEKDPPQELISVNPYLEVPTLVDRDLVLYGPNIIAEYLDERFPHPPLLPVYPVARAKCRIVIHRIEHDWISLVDRITLSNDPATVQLLRKDLQDQLVAIAPLFAEAPYFLSEEFTLADCCLAPMFWRLSSMGVEVPSNLKSIHSYIKRIFSREAFRESLSDQEVELVT